MRNRKAERARQRRLWLYFILVFALAVPFWIYAPALVGLAPALAGLLMAGPALLARAFDIDRLRDPALFILAPLALFAAAALLARLHDGAAPRIEPRALVLFPVFFVLAVAQELGWTGYALERFPNRWAGVSAGLVLASVWSVWSLAPLIETGNPPHWVFYTALAMMIFRVLMVWLYHNAGRSVVGMGLAAAVWNLGFLVFPSIAPAYLPPVLAGALTLALVAQGPRLLPRGSMKIDLAAHRDPARPLRGRARNLNRAAHRG